MISGGLDSVLAAAVIKRQGIAVTGLHFFNGFNGGTMRRAVCDGATIEQQADGAKRRLEELMGIDVRVIDVSVDFLRVLAAPEHGYGKNVNPCIDCRIFLLGRAREILEREGYDFVFTGEVLGQRPMSQNLKAMREVERQSGLEGRLLRPLCARLMAQTIPERDGLVDRSLLLDIQGRSRRRQMALAAELGITGYEQPAGGCTLTDENYARRYSDLAARGAVFSCEDTIVLSVGRHLRLSPSVKIVVGRRQEENEYLERAWSGSALMTTVDHPGPTTLVQGEASQEDLLLAAAITARYSDGKGERSVRVAIRSGGEERIVEVAPAEDAAIDRIRI